MTHVACESKLRLDLRSSLNPCPENWVAIGRAVVYYARAVHALSAGIKRRHCRFEHRVQSFLYSSWGNENYAISVTINLQL